MLYPAELRVYGVRGGSRTRNTQILSLVPLPIGLRGRTVLDLTILTADPSVGF